MFNDTEQPKFFSNLTQFYRLLYINCFIDIFRRIQWRCSTKLILLDYLIRLIKSKELIYLKKNFSHVSLAFNVAVVI